MQYGEQNQSVVAVTTVRLVPMSVFRLCKKYKSRHSVLCVLSITTLQLWIYHCNDEIGLLLSAHRIWPTFGKSIGPLDMFLGPADDVRTATQTQTHDQIGGVRAWANFNDTASSCEFMANPDKITFGDPVLGYMAKEYRTTDPMVNNTSVP